MKKLLLPVIVICSFIVTWSFFSFIFVCDKIMCNGTIGKDELIKIVVSCIGQALIATGLLIFFIIRAKRGKLL